MLLNEDPDTLAAEIGHTGCEPTWGGGLPRGHHPQEILDCCLRRGYGLVEIEFDPCLGFSESDSMYVYEENIARFWRLIAERPGIIITSNHAVAWDGWNIYDPRGWVSSCISDVQSAYLLAKM